LTFRQSVIDYEALALEPSGNDAEYENLYNQLRRLKFEPVGRRSTIHCFYFHHWYRNNQSRVFAAPQGDAIALAYKLWAWDQWRLCFVTAFSDGAIVETANQMEKLPHRRAGLSALGFGDARSRALARAPSRGMPGFRRGRLAQCQEVACR